MKRNFKLSQITLTLLLCIGLIGCTNKTIKSINIECKELTMDINKEGQITLNIDPNDCQPEVNDFQISDDNIISIKEIKDGKLIINSHDKEGSVSISYNDDKIKSNSLSFTVVDKVKQAEEAKKIEDQRKAELANEEALKKAEEEKKKQQTSSNASNSTKNNSASSQEPTTSGVYVTPTGKKYHSIPKCGNTKSSTKVSLSDAQSRGLTPCSKCY